MTSNQDILTFLTANQEAHAKEKEEDKKNRAKERQEDRDNILKLIKIGVQKEVKAAVEDVEHRLEKQENMNEELTKQQKSMISNGGQADIPSFAETKFRPKCQIKSWRICC